MAGDASLSEQRTLSWADFSNCSFKNLVETFGISSSSASGVSMTTSRKEHQRHYVTNKHDVWEEIMVPWETSPNISSVKRFKVPS